MNKGTFLKLSLAIILGIGSFPLAGCQLGAPKDDVSESQTATVTRGDLTTYISASGNLAYPETQDIRLEASGVVSAVLVMEGDMVRSGDILARLDDSTIRDTIKANQLNINSLEISLEKVTNTFKQLIYPYTYATFVFDVPEAIVALRDARRKINDAVAQLATGVTPEESPSAAELFHSAEEDLIRANERLTRGEGEEVFGPVGTGAPLQYTDFFRLRSAQLDMEDARVKLDKAEYDLETNEAELLKTVVKAPFDGLITQVNISDGADMRAGNVVLTMTRVNKFEANVLVNEIDIFMVKPEGKATVQIDAVPGMEVPARVVSIAPTAVIQSGVVNYRIKVELILSPDSALAEIATGNRAPGFSDIELREGLSATVNILKEEKKGVLLVPNRVIARQGIETSVQVLKADGTVETRTVKVGANDTRYTEVTDGLTEGDKVVLRLTASQTATQPNGGMRFGPP
ncbi:MAG: efflux RND transporter periplasmic adaptor subunit [Chloroflexota bacterium]